ncbi:hypothetical protein ACNI65_14170 [Roseateles sp. So40a]|uniref:hypothetical protein n=1 Tax=Roseateles sp. So40a TaxID=3400226 RepID=UPI003A8A8069
MTSNAVEKEPVLAASGVEAGWPPHRWVRVDSKSQAPYKFFPCFNPCAPNEWPYDLQALIGTEDWNDVIAWFLERHPAVSGQDLHRFAEELVRCVPGREISVEVSNDPELGTLSLWFTLWGFGEEEWGLESREVRTMNQLWFSVPAFRLLFGSVGIDAKRGEFADRHERWGG